MDRCFTTVHTDKEGGSEGMISQTFVDEQSCKQTCLGRNDCKSLSYFTIGNSRACQIYSVTLPTTLTDRPGALHFVKECPSGRCFRPYFHCYRTDFFFLYETI